MSGIIMGSGDGAYDADVAADIITAKREASEAMRKLDDATDGEMTRGRMVTLKERNQKIPKGETVVCPTCETLFVKKHPKQAFCNKDGRHRCKDVYHNATNPARLERTRQYLSRRHGE